MPGFLTPSGAWLLLLIPPLVALYFLKLKRPQLEIPSLVLWRQVLSDSRVNAPFQRFKRNILLWLQLLLLLLLIGAAMQPFRRSAADRVTNLPVLIDTSASMGARDGPDGPSRLELARRRVSAMIDNLLPDQQLCLISFDRTARRHSGFTNNRRVLAEALDRIHVTDVGSDIEDAMRVTQALSRTAAFEQALLLSDGNFPAHTDFEQSFRIDYQKLAPAGPNIGISALNARRTTGRRWEVFVNIESSAADRMGATVHFHVDGEPMPTEPISVDRNGMERLVYPVVAEQHTRIEVRLEPDGFDALAADNLAWLDLNPARPLQVYAQAALERCRAALELDDVSLTPPPGTPPAEDGAADAAGGPGDDGGERSGGSTGGGMAQSVFDLVISSNAQDLGLEAPVHMFVDVVPDDVQSLVDIETGTGSSVIDWRRNAPLLEHVLLAEVLLGDSPAFAAAAADADFDQSGYEILAYGRAGPLLLQKREGPRLIYYWLVDLNRTTLPWRPGFPIMMLNLVNQAMHRAGLSETRGAPTGVLPPIVLAPDVSYRVRPPRGATREIRSDPDGLLSGVPAPYVGRYEILGPDGTVANTAASLLDEMETRLVTVDQIMFDELTVSAGPPQVEVNRPYWPLLALLALFVLMVEWWFFQRRPGGWRR